MMPAEKLPDVDVSFAARDYVRAGWVLVPFDRSTKGPQHKGWNLRERCVATEEAATKTRGNVGLAHAYSRTAVIDFDDLARARDWLAAKGITLAALWDAADAVRISSGRENRGKLLYKLPDGLAPLASRKIIGDGKAVLFELRCATSNGLTVQDVLPPSIHPVTGRPYVWEYADPMFGDWRSPPVLPPELVQLWQTLAPESTEPVEQKEPLGLGRRELKILLNRLDPDTDYDEWLGVGMALHHECRGGEIGLELWDTWSSKGTKYKGVEDLQRRWDGFKQGTGRLLTARWLMGLADVATVDEFDDLTDDLFSADERPRFQVQQADALASAYQADYFIKGVLPRDGLAVLYGESGAGKSFIVLDMLGAIVRGVPWRGQRVRQARVVYVCAEGQRGFAKRWQAYKSHNALPLVDGFMVITDVPNLLQQDDKVIAERLAEAGGVDLIVFDTFAQVTPGANENASEDVGKALRHCRRLHDATGATVVLVHHAGKDLTRGARGWSGLKAAADVELEVTRDGRYRSVRLSKSKDGEDGTEMPFTLHTVAIGVDSDGDPVTSCVVEHAELVVRTAAKREPKGANQRLLLEVIREMLDLGDGSVPVAAARRTARARMAAPEGGKDNRNRDLDRAFAALQSEAFIAIYDDLITLRD